MLSYNEITTGKVINYEGEPCKVVSHQVSRKQLWFHEEGAPGKRFALPGDLVGAKVKFLRSKDTYDALLFNEEIIGIDIPIKMQLRVTEAAPAVKGNTAQGATKSVTVETGATVNVPLFINEGDVIDVNTETEEYAGRSEKN
jgi:elongation factor P